MKEAIEIMKRKILIVVGVIYVAFIVEFILYLSSDSDSETPVRIEKISQPSEHKSLSNPSDGSLSGAITPQNQSPSLQPVKSQQVIGPENSDHGSKPEHSTDQHGTGTGQYLEQESVEYADIEEIKKKIYNMNIEYIEDLENLEQIVQTGDADQADFWKGDWHSVDDWKRRHDSFQLEINENGSFSFATEDRIHQPSQAFTFDDEKGEFYWEEDYYGKIISHRAKFITPSTLLIIKTSGVKVNLDIYEKAEN